MRIEYNPNRDQQLTSSPFFHQVIIPVYIPLKEGYHRDSFNILKICLESLFKTAHKKTFFTCVNNGSGPEVREYLNQLFEQGKIQEVIHTENIGKVNSILKALKGHDFDLVTIADSDVLFLPGWQEEGYAMFRSFKKLAALSTSPNPKLLKFHTWNLIHEFFFSDKLRFTSVEDPQGLKQFTESISNPDLFKPCHYEKNLTLTSGGKIGVLGAGHFVVTYRKELFKDFSLNFAKFKLGGDSEGILDRLVSQKGGWRLSTSKSFSLHMGNIEEPWMKSYLESISQTGFNPETPALPPLERIGRLGVFYANSILPKILNNRLILRGFLKFKGLDKKYISSY